MPATTHLLRPFAESIRAKARAVAILDLDERQRRRFLEAISDDIKKCTNFLVPEVSVAAAQRALAKGLDLRQMDWHDQHRFDPGRVEFHFEHMVPVAAIRARCLQARTVADVLAVLRDSLRVAWILKDEDARLTAMGYRTNRPDPESAYRMANIALSARDPEVPAPREPSEIPMGEPDVIRQAYPPASAVDALRAAVGWDPSPIPYDRLLDASYTHFSVHSGSRLVAFLSVISDGVCDALLVDIMVHPEFQRRGLGQALVRKAVHDLISDGIGFIQVVFEPRLEPFYLSCGSEITKAGVIDRHPKVRSTHSTMPIGV